MDKKEYDWHLKKVGKFSASCIDKITSASGKWTQGNISYLYHIQYQRKNKIPDAQAKSYAMKLGVDNEPYAFEWMKANWKQNILHCNTDFTEKIFVEIPEIGYGASPDGYVISDNLPIKRNEKNEITNHDEIIHNIESLIEVKCVVGENMYWMFSDTVPYEKKRISVFAEHRGQMAGQLLAFPSVNSINLMVYLPQIDENEYDCDSPVDPRRGLIFNYKREEFGAYIQEIEDRIRFANDFLTSGEDLDSINDFYKIKK